MGQNERENQGKPKGLETYCIPKLISSRQMLAPSVHFYAGEWEELPTVLSIVRSETFEVTTGMSLSFSEEDFMDGCSSQDGSIIGKETSSRRSRKLLGSRAWERASETGHGEGGYDVILMTDIPHSVSSLKKLYTLIKKTRVVFKEMNFNATEAAAASRPVVKIEGPGVGAVAGALLLLLAGRGAPCWLLMHAHNAWRG
uniref:Uncharacterized protein n=1 Tax=Populus alba TaxID=43335 RepID=A0A4U5QEK2_POPAL|nr:hypothetical protein D5086_0000104210 [Populus alba]